MKAPFFLAALSLACATAAHAHSWYSDRMDPKFRNNCCGGHDCAPLDTKFITITKDGLVHVSIPAEAVRAINPVRREAFEAVIDPERIQTSEDGQWHICIMGHDVPSDTRNGYFCIFSPPNT